MKSWFYGSIDDKPLKLETKHRKFHTHICGGSGTGKSKFLENLMREDLRNNQGFCLIDPHGKLYDDIVNFASYSAFPQEIILLNLSDPKHIIGFNPFKRYEDADVSVQAENIKQAILHAWNVEDGNQTPTLERILTLVIRTILEGNLTFKDTAKLLSYSDKDFREPIIEKIESDLLKNEWYELEAAKQKDFRDEILSTKNRLYKLLTSYSLMRFFDLSEPCLDIQEIIEQGKVLLVNLRPSKFLARGNAKVFGSLLINEFYQQALNREIDETANKPEPYFLYLDEFQNFVSIDLADMLDEVRKFGIFLNLAHQRFGQLSEDMLDAILTNTQIKAVFGNLEPNTATLMSEVLFLNQIDVHKVKDEIFQTKFRPIYTREKIYTKGSSYGISQSESKGQSTGFTSGSSEGKNTGISITYTDSEGFFNTREELNRIESEGSNTSYSSIQNQNESQSFGYSFSDSESESVADTPFYLMQEFSELSSKTYYTIEEQMTEFKKLAVNQQQGQCFIKIGQYTHLLKVPYIQSQTALPSNYEWYINKKLEEQNAVPIALLESSIEQENKSEEIQTISEEPIKDFKNLFKDAYK
jgi:TraM recognition site of TraD and TraG/Helicase HerA, central domain